MKFLLSILLVFSSSYCRADWGACSYYLKGKIIDISGKAVSNKQCTLRLGMNYRYFVTDIEGNYFVEVIYARPRSCTKKETLEEQIESAREYNDDTIYISSSSGNGNLKANWEKYCTGKKEHQISKKYDGLSFVEYTNIELDPDRTDVLPDAQLANVIRTKWLNAAEQRKKLTHYSNEVDLDSLEIASSMEFVSRTECPDSLNLEERSNWESVPKYKFKDESEHFIRSDDPLRRYNWVEQEISGGVYNILESIELRNRNVNYIFSDECLGNCRKIVPLKKINRNTYYLHLDQFKEKGSFYRITVNENDLVTDVIYEDPMFDQ